MSEQQAKRIPFTTSQVICPEGIWIPEAMLLFHEKGYGSIPKNKNVEDAARDFLSFLLRTPKLELFKIDSVSGYKDLVEKDYLRSKSAQSDILKGYSSHLRNFYDDADEEDGFYIFVNKEQFENFLADKPISENTISEVGKTNSDESYTPAYLDLMLKAVKALNLSPDLRANKDLITDWLTENWPSDLEGKSDRLIESMATLMRRPEDKKGGNHSMK